MTPAEADQFIMRARRVLRGWQIEIESLSGEDRDDAQSARDSVLHTLMEIAEEFPSKRAKIDRIAARYGYGMFAAPWLKRGNTPLDS